MGFYLAFHAAAGDPDYLSNILLLNFDSDFSDTSQYILADSVAGGATAGGGVADFDGTGDFVLYTRGTEWNLGTDDFTVEVVCNPTTLKTVFALLTNRSPNPGTPDEGIILVGNAAGLLQFVAWGAPVGLAAVVIVNMLTANGVVTTGVVQHICIVRNGSSWTLAVDGVSQATATSSDAVSDGFTLCLAEDPSNGSRDYDGQMTGVRVTRGVARYTSFPFTPEMPPWPDHT